MPTANAGNGWMAPEGAKSQSLNAVTVVLVLPDPASLDYLQNILQFIDCDVHVPESPEYPVQRGVNPFIFGCFGFVVKVKRNIFAARITMASWRN